MFVFLIIYCIYISKKAQKREQENRIMEWKREAFEELECEGYLVPMGWKREYRKFEEVIRKYKNNLKFL